MSARVALRIRHGCGGTLHATDRVTAAGVAVRWCDGCPGWLHGPMVDPLTVRGAELTHGNVPEGAGPALEALAARVRAAAADGTADVALAVAMAPARRGAR